MKTFKQFIEEQKKVVLYTHPETFGATVSNTNSNLRNIKNIPLYKLHPIEPEDKMKQPGSKQTYDKLVGSIKLGKQIPPIIVIPHPTLSGHYQIVDGHHRFFASKNAGKRTIQCEIISTKNVTITADKWEEK